MKVAEEKRQGAEQIATAISGFYVSLFVPIRGEERGLAALRHGESEQARRGLTPDAGGQDPDPSGLDPDPDRLKLLEGGLDSDRLRSEAEASRVDPAEFHPAKDGVRWIPEGVGLEHDEVESDRVGFQSAEDGVRRNDGGVVSDAFGFQSDSSDFESAEVGGGPNAVDVESDAFRFQSDASELPSDEVGIRLKQVGGGPKQLGVESDDLGFQSTTSGFPSWASRFRLAESFLRFETAVFPKK